MNSKVFFIALAIIALQVVQSHAQSAGDNRMLDLSDKDADLAANLGFLLGPGARDLSTHQRLMMSKRFFDITGVLKALQAVADTINGMIQNTTNAVLNAITGAFRLGQNLVQSAVDGWDRNLQTLIDGVNGLESAVEACRQVKPTLEDVQNSLNGDIQICVQNSSVAAQAALGELNELGDNAQSLVTEAQKIIESCESSGIFLNFCVATKLPGLAIKATGLAARAAFLGAKVAGELVVAIPVESAACGTVAVAKRTIQAAQVIDRIGQCVRDTTPAPATSSPSTSPSVEPATSASISTAPSVEPATSASISTVPSDSPSVTPTQGTTEPTAAA